MMIIGYGRVSTTSQSLLVQREQLLAAGCEKVFEENRTYAKSENIDVKSNIR